MTTLGHKIIEIASPDGDTSWADDAIAQRVAKRVLELVRPIVIEELCEPTPEMLKAGGLGMLGEEFYFRSQEGVSEFVFDIWQAMLNAAKR